MSMFVKRRYKTIGFSVPPGMATRIEETVKERQLTKSEFFRDMFQAWEEKNSRERVFDERLTQALLDVEEEKKRNPKSKEEILDGLIKMSRAISERARELGLEITEGGNIREKQI